jgi:hypothetical protein
MNFRVLCKIEGDVLYVHRVIKHDLADSARVNQNDRSDAPYMMSHLEIQPSDVFHALLSLGLPEAYVKSFRSVKDEDSLIEVLGCVDEKLSSFALALYETSGLVIPRTKYALMQSDQEFESMLAGGQARWELYLHPSQQYIVNLPSNYRLAVSGSAGTGKTVCAWYRLHFLANQAQVVGLVCPNDSALKVSRHKVEELLKDIPAQSYFLVPSSAADMIELASQVDHIIIDEGQEFSPGWYVSLGKFLQGRKTGLTLFYDLNQLGGNITSGDTRRYKDRLSSWDGALMSIPECRSTEFYINYRNSREIAEFYRRILEKTLPSPIRSEVPVFETGEVVVIENKDAIQLPAVIADVIRKLRPDFDFGEIAIVCLEGTINDLYEGLMLFGIPITTDVESKGKVFVTRPRQIRGHERKAIIVCSPPEAGLGRKLGKSIDAYIALSRARDRLILIQTM